MRDPKYGCYNLVSPLLNFWSPWTGFISFCALRWRSFCFRLVVVDPCFIHCHIPTQKILVTSLKQLQTALWILDAFLFLIECKQTRHPLRKQFTHPQKFVQKIVNTLISDIFRVSAISRNFNFRSPKTILWTFVMFSGTTADFWRPERSASSVFVRPRLNSAYQSMIAIYMSYRKLIAWCVIYVYIYIYMYLGVLKKRNIFFIFMKTWKYRRTFLNKNSVQSTAHNFTSKRFLIVPKVFPFK